MMKDIYFDKNYGKLYEHIEKGKAHIFEYEDENGKVSNYMFYECSSLTNLDVSNFKTNQVTDMSFMFRDCSSLTNLDLSSFDTGQVTTMRSMFNGCSNLIKLDLSNFDTSQSTNMYYMLF